MVKYLLLVLVTFIDVAYAQGFRISEETKHAEASRADKDTQDIRRSHEQIIGDIFIRWKNNPNRQKYEPDTDIISAREAVNITRNAIMEYYGINYTGSVVTSYSGIHRIHFVTRVRGVPTENEQITFLILRGGGKIVSMHRDTINP